MDKVFMQLSIVPYLLFLYLIWRIRKVNPKAIHLTTFIGFIAMLGFIIETAILGTIAIKVIGASTLAHADYLHGPAEFGLTIVNGLIALGLKQQSNDIDRAKDRPEEVEVPVGAVDA